MYLGLFFFFLIVFFFLLLLLFSLLLFKVKGISCLLSLRGVDISAASTWVGNRLCKSEVRLRNVLLSSSGVLDFDKAGMAGSDGDRFRAWNGEPH